MSLILKLTSKTNIHLIYGEQYAKKAQKEKQLLNRAKSDIRFVVQIEADFPSSKTNVRRRSVQQIFYHAETLNNRKKKSTSYG